MSLKRRHAALIVLDAILAGHDIELPEGTILRWDPDTARVRLIQPGSLMRDDTSESVDLDLDDTLMTLNAFVKVCSNLPEERVLEIGANKAFQDLRNKNR